MKQLAASRLLSARHERRPQRHNKLPASPKMSSILDRVMTSIGIKISGAVASIHVLHEGYKKHSCVFEKEVDSLKLNPPQFWGS